jgi:hypothetical protein
MFAFCTGGLEDLAIPLATPPLIPALEASKPILFPVVFKP